jgi:hypothetical protein
MLAAEWPGVERKVASTAGFRKHREALGEYLDVPVTTIRDWRTDGKGPCAIRVGGRVRFAVSDVLSWLAEQRETEPGRGPEGR